MDETKGMTRAELNDYAGELGIADAAEMANKDEVIAAIEAELSNNPEPNPDAEYEDADSEPTTGAESEPARQRYFLLKAVTVEDGTTYMPGESVAFGPAFTSRRLSQLVDQKFLRPLD